ncbi:MAG: hypothetical protein IPK22_16945 [Verrucomicrobiaceae bacterium]|nr:hypothetical protein [Verrucomicrobiaceae bacterium]
MTKEKVVGKYAGKLPSGRIELWVLEDGGRFLQEIFRDDKDYLAGRAYLSFESSWSINEGRLCIKQIVETFEWFPPFKTTEPTKVKLASPLLWLPEGWGGVPIIEILDDYGITYVKIEKATDPVRVFGRGE